MATKPVKEKLSPVKILERLNFLKSDRSTFQSHWQDLALYIQPNRSDITITFTPGTKRNLQLLDNTAMISNELLAGFLHGMLTNPNAPFFELTTGNEALDLQDGVRQFLQTTSLRMHDVLNNSNFQTEVHQYYLDLTSLGTACLSVEEDDEHIVRFASRHIKGIWVSENNKGRVDEIFHEFDWDIKQIVAEFGHDVLKLHTALQEAWENNKNQTWKIVHAVYPKDVTETQSPQRYCSQYVLEFQGGIELEFGFFRTLPFIVSRWSKASGEKYGRSPGMTALPDAKTLNKMTETMIIAAQKAVDPPIQAPDDTFVLPIKTRPGGINYYRSGTPDRLQPIYNNANIDFGEKALQERRSRIREAFYVDQLQLQQGPQMTATEVLQRTEEKMRLLGPVLGRQQSEFLRPLIERVFEIMDRHNLIKIDEATMQTFKQNGIQKIDVTYSSMIAKAQKAEDGQAINRTLQAVAPFASFDQGVFDNFDADYAVRKLAKIYGYPQEGLRDKDDVENTRNQRMQAQKEAVQQQEQANQVQQASQILPAASKVIKAQSEAGAA